MRLVRIRPIGIDAMRAGATAPAPGGWIEWFGGECPVAPDTPVHIRLGIEDVFDEDQPARRADTWRWDHGERCRRANITHYRRVQP